MQLKERIQFKTLSAEETADRTLALDVSIRDNWLSYAVYGKGRKLLHFSSSETEGSLEDNQPQFAEWVRTHEWLKREYEQTRVLWNSSRYTVAPAEFTSPASLTDLTRYQFESRKNEVLRSTAVGEHSVLYPVDENLYYAVRNRFADAEHEHIGARVLNWYLSEERENQVLLRFDENQVQVLFAESGKLQFCQSFPFSTENEAAYFVLNALEKLNISRETVRLRMVGIAPDNAIRRLLDTYVRKTEIVKIPLPELLQSAWQHHPMLISLL